MSININLYFQTKIALDFLSEGIPVKLIRLLGIVQLKTKSGWSLDEPVIIDTGNPISIIPYSIWQNIDKKILLSAPTSLYGLGATENSALTGRLAQLTIIFKDEHHISPPMNIKAHLLDNDQAPFIIGYEDILTVCKLVSDYKHDTAYLEFD